MWMYHRLFLTLFLEYLIAHDIKRNRDDLTKVVSEGSSYELSARGTNKAPDEAKYIGNKERSI